MRSVAPTWGLLDASALVLLVSSASLLLLTVLETSIPWTSVTPLSNPQRHSYRGNDFPREWDIQKAPLGPAQITMENTVHFAYNTTLGDLEWKATLPPGGGLLYFDSATVTNEAEASEGGPQGQPFSISMFHQIRCLDIIRQALVAFEDSGRASAARPKSGGIAHHCMNYLRQMVLCRSDLTLEHARHLRRGIAVSDVTHGDCKDWERVWEAAQANHDHERWNSRVL